MRWFQNKQKAEAERFGIPFERRDFWPPFYISFRSDNIPYARCCLTDLYDAAVGDVVAVFQDGAIYHRYKLLGVSWAPGSDHIVSPKQFDIRYVESVYREDAKDGSVHPVINKMLPLRISEDFTGTKIKTRNGVDLRLGYWDNKDDRDALMRFIAQAANARSDLLKVVRAQELEEVADVDG